MNIHMFFNATTRGMSGGDKRALEILSSFLKKSIECTVYVPRDFAQTIQNEGMLPTKTIVTSTKKSQSRNIIIKYMIHTFMALRCIPKRQQGIIFYCTSAYLPDMLPALSGKRRNKNSFLIVPVFHLIEHYRSRPGGKINNIIAYYEQRFSLLIIKRNANIILVINSQVKEYLEQHGFLSERILLVDCGIDAELIKTSKSFDDVKKCYDAVYMGRLAPSKGVLELPDVWKEVVLQFPKARLAIIGSGTSEMKKNLECKITAFGLNNNIDLLGYLDSYEALSYMKSAKLFIFPSHEEGWGIAIADAMACGLPVISYDLPVYKHIFQGINCEAPSGDPSQMAKLTIKLLANDSLRQELRLRGKEFVFRNYIWETIASKELDILKKMESLI